MRSSEVYLPSVSLYPCPCSVSIFTFHYFIWVREPLFNYLWSLASTASFLVFIYWSFDVLVKKAGKVGWLFPCYLCGAVTALFEARLELAYLPPPPMAFFYTRLGYWGLGTLTHWTCYAALSVGGPIITAPPGLSISRSPLSIMPRMSWSLRCEPPKFEKIAFFIILSLKVPVC